MDEPPRWSDEGWEPRLPPCVCGKRHGGHREATDASGQWCSGGSSQPSWPCSREGLVLLEAAQGSGHLSRDGPKLKAHLRTHNRKLIIGAAGVRKATWLLGALHSALLSQGGVLVTAAWGPFILPTAHPPLHPGLPPLLLLPCSVSLNALNQNK